MIKAKCVRTGRKVLLEEGFLVAAPSTGKWSFVCASAPEQHGDYAVAVKKLLQDPEEFFDWMAHLQEKTWFSASEFFAFFRAFRAANNLFGEI